MSYYYWEDAQDFVKYNPNYRVSQNTTVRFCNDFSEGGWFNVCSGDAGRYFRGKQEHFHNYLQKYFQDWDNQTQKEWDLVCMMYSLPRVYVKGSK